MAADSQVYSSTPFTSTIPTVSLEDYTPDIEKSTVIYRVEIGCLNDFYGALRMAQLGRNKFRSFITIPLSGSDDSHRHPLIKKAKDFWRPKEFVAGEQHLGAMLPESCFQSIESYIPMIREHYKLGYVALHAQSYINSLAHFTECSWTALKSRDEDASPTRQSLWSANSTLFYSAAAQAICFVKLGAYNKAYGCILMAWRVLNAKSSRISNIGLPREEYAGLFMMEGICLLERNQLTEGMHRIKTAEVMSGGKMLLDRQQYCNYELVSGLSAYSASNASSRNHSLDASSYCPKCINVASSSAKYIQATLDAIKKHKHPRKLADSCRRRLKLQSNHLSSFPREAIPKRPSRESDHQTTRTPTLQKLPTQAIPSFRPRGPGLSIGVNQRHSTLMSVNRARQQRREMYLRRARQNYSMMRRHAADQQQRYTSGLDKHSALETGVYEETIAPIEGIGLGSKDFDGLWDNTLDGLKK